MTAQRVAIVDQGSNSTRLFLCEGIDRDGPVGERVTTVTALKAGAAPDGRIAETALARLDACLAGYAQRIAAFVPDEVVVVGTSAVRDAPNRQAVADLVRRRLDAPLTVLAGAEEAELAYVGARLAVKGSGRVIVMDIGGGSTELVQGGPDGPHSAVSMDLGSVRQTEALLHDDPPTPAQVDALLDEARAMAGEAFAVIGSDAPIVGVAGTMTSLAAIAQGAYDPARVHRARLEVTQVAAIMRRLAALPLDELRHVPGLHPDRAPAIIAGSCICLGVLQAAGAQEVTVSERDLLDGAVLRLTNMAR